MSKKTILGALLGLSNAFDFDAEWNRIFPPENPDPVVGVIDANSCREWIYEEINAGTDLGLIEHLSECEDHKSGRGCDCEVDWGRVLIGDWKKSWVWRMPGGREVKAHTPGSKRHQVWVEVKDGPNSYSAMYNKSGYTIQVTWSKWIFQDARWCSPCYPGQADLNSDGGGVVAYQLPPELSRCVECKDYEREVVYATGAEGRMLCDVCCEKYGIDFKTGEKQ